jgi:DNA-nicking Smr family endonuclease
MTLPAKIDLHGLTVQQGFSKSLMFIKVHQMAESRHCKIITGVSGRMRKEFEAWIENPVFATYVDSIKEFDNHGSFIVTIKKKVKA